MESYELDPETILEWATEYATYEDLETVAKALYGVYAYTRKQLSPEDHARAKKIKKYIN